MEICYVAALAVIANRGGVAFYLGYGDGADFFGAQCKGVARDEHQHNRQRREGKYPVL